MGGYRAGMTTDERVIFETLRLIEENEPISPSALRVHLADCLSDLGIAAVGKVDAAYVARLLAHLRKAEPALISVDYAPSDVDHLGRPRPGTERLFSLTDAGDTELDRLKRLAESDNRA
jgi:hypothetical protein